MGSTRLAPASTGTLGESSKTMAFKARHTGKRQSAKLPVVRLLPEHLEQAKRAAREQQVTLSELVRQIVQHYIENYHSHLALPETTAEATVESEHSKTTETTEDREEFDRLYLARIANQKCPHSLIPANCFICSSVLSPL